MVSNLIMMFLLFFTISLLFLLINFLISKKSFKNREKSSPFECGFDPLSNNRIPFSIHFFLISLIFLIFDIEISILIPLISMISFSNKFLIISSLIFFMILILGIYIEFFEKSFNWKL